MHENQHNIWNQRLPQFIGAFFLFFSLGAIFWLSSNVVLIGTKAAVGSVPKQIQISNISDTQFTITYTTDEKVTGTVAYGITARLGSIEFDDRELTGLGSGSPSRTHHITIKNLRPATRYYFSIISGTETFQNNKAPYEVFTAPLLSTSPSAHTPVTGKITLDDGTIPAEGIVTITAPDAQVFSTLLKPDGTYVLPINSMRKADLSAFFPFTADTMLTIKVVDATKQSVVSAYANQADPVPPIILSKTYDFTISDDQLESEEVTPSAETTAFLSPEDTGPAEPKILIPTTKQEFKTQRPTLSGKALPNANVEIILESADTITATVTADNTGNWEFRPDTALDPGNYTITIATPDSSDVTQTLSESFVVFADGSQFTEPSIPPKKTSTPTPTPKPTEAPTATPTPTKVVTPTIDPSKLTPTIDPKNAMLSLTPAGGIGGSGGSGSGTGSVTQPPLPKSGSSDLLFGIIGIGSFITIGTLLFFLTAL